MAQTGPGPGGGAAPTGSGVVSEAATFIGDPYVYGAAGPTSFDCSGLVQYTLGQLGISAPRTSEDQWAWVQRFSDASKLQAGDLIFEQFPGDNASPGHVAIYAGNNQIIQAPAPGQDVQKIAWTPSTSGGTVVGYGKIPGVSYNGEVTGGGSSPGSDSGTLPSGVSEVLSGVLSGLTGSSVNLGSLDPLSGIGAGIGALAKEFEGLGTALTWLTMPSSWVRIFAGVAGSVFLGAGVWFLMQEAGNG
jgi:hypothetical protein